VAEDRVTAADGRRVLPYEERNIDVLSTRYIHSPLALYIAEYSTVLFVRCGRTDRFEIFARNHTQSDNADTADLYQGWDKNNEG
jgi:hypothetical protein